ncbi:MAG TPA: Arc family DNA-binding protein [Pyrinomonadaceae bacterium]|nr:Arc family DNA-binding protein [Pyrinomonadaceae bacterium]
MATLTIKNLPDEIYSSLTKTAKLHRRSINSEAIVQLQTSLGKQSVGVETELEEIRKFRESIKGVYLTDEDLEFAKNEGRP